MGLVRPTLAQVLKYGRGPYAESALPWESGAGGLPWTPALLTGLEAWYRGDDVVLSGSSIAAWNDKGGHGWQLSQATGLARPTQVTRAGQLCASFDGGDYVQGAFTTLLPQPLTIYHVYEASSLTTSGFYDGDDVTNRCTAFVNTSLRAFAGSTLVGPVLSTGTIYGAAVVYNGVASAIYNNNFVTAAASGDTGSAGIDGFTIGAFYNAGNRLTGFVWETIVCSGAHSQATRALVGAYLTARYEGLTVVI